MKEKIFFNFILLFSFFFLQFQLSAQEVTGKIEGQITDTSGTAISGVTLTVSSPDLQGTRKTQTNADGLFRFLLLPPGIYTLNITHISYRSISVDSIWVILGKTTFAGRLAMTDKPYETEELVVENKRIRIDPTSTVLGGNFTKTDIEELPLQRNYRDISLLLPQVNTSYFGDGNSYAGSTGSDNKFFIDGIDVTNPVTNVSGTNLPYNFIREIEVKTGGYESEYKSSLGGVVNVISYTGGDRFSGQVFGFFTNNRVSQDAKYAVETERPTGDYAYYDFGINLNGPVVKENLWFNLAYNPNIAKEDILIPGIGYKPKEKTSHLFAGKLSWRVSDKSQIILNILGDPGGMHDVRTILPPGTTSYSSPDAALMYLKDGGYSTALSGFYIFSDRFTIEAGVSRFYSRYIIDPDSPAGKQPVFINYVDRTISGGYGEYYDRKAEKLDANIKATLSFGSHKIKFGCEYTNNNLDEGADADFLRKYSDTSYFRIVTKQDGNVGNRVPSFFLQDFWQINNSFRINAGLRWDGQYIVNSEGGVSQKILDQFQPRIGIIFLPEQNDNQKIFATYGRFYHDLNLYGPVLFYTKNAVWIGLDYTHDPRIDPSGADTSYVLTSGFQENNPELKGQYYDEFTLGYERVIFNNHRFSARGVYRTLGNGINDAYSTELGKFVWGNPGSYPLSEYPKMKRDYFALEISLKKISSEPFNYSLSYVLSRDYGNYPGLYNPETMHAGPNTTEFFDFPETTVNSTGLLPYDRTHVIKFFGSYCFDFGLTIGTNLTWSSGTPLCEYGVTQVVYPFHLIKRGTAGRTPSIWDINFRFAYVLPMLFSPYYKARLLLDIFHFASPQTAVNYDQLKYLAEDEYGNQIEPNPTYGREISFQPPMSLRFGLEVSF